MTRPRLLVGDVFERMAELDDRLLDCGHPDPTPDTGHTDNDGRAVCPDCCDTCGEAEQ